MKKRRKSAKKPRFGGFVKEIHKFIIKEGVDYPFPNWMNKKERKEWKKNRAMQKRLNILRKG